MSACHFTLTILILSINLLGSSIVELPAQVIPDQRIVLVHGFMSSPQTWSTVTSRWPSEESYIKAVNLFTPTYDWDVRVATQAQQIAGQLSQLSNDRLMIAHSGGTPVARQYVRNHPTGPVRSLILIASPNGGAPLANRPYTASNYLFILTRTLIQGPCTLTMGQCRVPGELLMDHWFNIVVGLMDEFLKSPSMQDMEPGSASVVALNSTPEPVKTAAITISDVPAEAEVVKLVASRTQWNEATSERVHSMALIFYSGAAGVLERFCRAKIALGQPNHRYCRAAGEFAAGYIMLSQSDKVWRAMVSTTGDDWMEVSDGIIPAAYQDIESPGGSIIRAFPLGREVHHLRQTRDTEVRKALGILIETRNMAVIPQWHNTAPRVSFSTAVSGPTLEVASTTTNPYSANLEFRWYWGDGIDTGWVSSTSASHAYVSSGVYSIRLEAREQGVNEIITSDQILVSITVGGNPPPPPPGNGTDVALASGNMLPGTVSAGEIVATSVSMKNGGSTTWNPDEYSLQSQQSQIWTPSSVSLGTATVMPGATHTFQFNISSWGYPFCGFQDNYWIMSRNGNPFAEQNGRQTYIKYCKSGGPLPVIAPTEVAGPEAGPRASASADLATAETEEVVQVLRATNLPLPVEEINTTREFRIRYLARLQRDWDVNYRITISVDPSVFRLGSVMRGTRGQGHEVRTTVHSQGNIVITGLRTGARGIPAGEGVILEIPLVLHPNAEVPEYLPFLELVVTR